MVNHLENFFRLVVTGVTRLLFFFLIRESVPVLAKVWFRYAINPRPHTEQPGLQIMRNFYWETLDHPAHSTDLITSEYKVFGVMKNPSGYRFTWRRRRQPPATVTWLTEQALVFYLSGSDKLSQAVTSVSNFEGTVLKKEIACQWYLHCVLTGFTLYKSWL
jgi:hypothetical protein